MNALLIRPPARLGLHIWQAAGGAAARAGRCHTKDEKPGSGARERAMLFMTIWPPLRLTTAEPSGSESV